MASYVVPPKLLVLLDGLNGFGIPGCFSRAAWHRPVHGLSRHIGGLELTGTESICWKAFADAMEAIPTTLAENAGLNSIRVVTDLRHRHELGERNAGGVSIKSGGVNSNISKENVLQPLLVSTSAIELAAETFKMILRIDDIALSR